MGREAGFSTGERTEYDVTVNLGELGFSLLARQGARSSSFSQGCMHTRSRVIPYAGMTCEIAVNTDLETLEPGILAEIRAGFLQAHGYIFINRS